MTDQQKDTLTILFALAHGETPRGKRSDWTILSHLHHQPVQVPVNPDREDFGIGDLLDDPEVLAVHVAWLDDYGDNKEPVLALTGLFRQAQSDHSEAQLAVKVMSSAIKVPTLPSGAHSAEWIATYMRDNVYHDDMQP
jgi:hypothetical protein